MKTLEQLGISPSPWKYIGYHYHRNGEYIHLGEVWVKGGKHKIVVDISQPDASLIAAAPDLYEALQMYQEAFSEIRKSAWFLDANFHEIMSLNKVMTAADAALAKAAGESEVRK